MGEIRREAAKGHNPGLAASRREIAQLEGRLGELATDIGLAAAGAAPAPLGAAADVISLGRSIWKGDFGGVLFDAVGLVPAVGDAAKAGRIAKQANRLREALNAVRALYEARITRTAAKRYWDEAIAARRNQNIRKKMDVAERAKDTGRLPSGDRGDWVDPKTGKPAAPGTGNHVPKPEENSSLHAALKKYGKEK